MLTEIKRFFFNHRTQPSLEDVKQEILALDMKVEFGIERTLSEVRSVQKSTHKAEQAAIAAMYAANRTENRVAFIETVVQCAIVMIVAFVCAKLLIRYVRV
jgi:hypothetical protein